MYFKCILFFTLIYCIGNGNAVMEKLQKCFGRFKPDKEWPFTLEVATDVNWEELLLNPIIETFKNGPVETALIRNNCPPNILKGLLENSNEEKWPPGLSTLESRQNNRPIMNTYKCRRIPGVDAVVMLNFENPTIPEDMKAEPGLLFVFEKE